MSYNQKNDYKNIDLECLDFIKDEYKHCEAERDYQELDKILLKLNFF